MLEVRSLRKSYDSTPAVRDVSFTIKPSEILGYLGSNGAGKSTTVKMLIGLMEPSDGSIFYQGRSVRSLRASAPEPGFVVGILGDVPCSRWFLDCRLSVQLFAGRLDDQSATPTLVNAHFGCGIWCQWQDDGLA